MTDIVIVGAGGFGREVYSWLLDWIDAKENRSQNYRVKGFLSLDDTLLHNFNLPVDVLGDETTYDIEPQDEFVIAIGSVEPKVRTIQTLVERNASFFTLIHPSAIICRSANIGVGAVICPMACVNANATICDYATLNIYASVGHDAKLGEFSVMSPYSTLNGFVVVDSRVFLGSHATILPSKKVGQNARIGANALVVHNVEADTTVLCPASHKIPNLG